LPYSSYRRKKSWPKLRGKYYQHVERLEFSEFDVISVTEMNSSFELSFHLYLSIRGKC
jgi:hypothetical protein